MSASDNPFVSLQQAPPTQPTASTPPAPTGDNPFNALAANDSPPAQQPTSVLDSVGNFLGGAYDTTLKPIGGMIPSDANYAKSIYNQAGAHLANGDYLKAAGTLMGAMTGADADSPINQMFSSILDAHKAEAQKTVALAKAGRYTEAVGHGLATALPVLGPAAAKAGEDIGSGEIAKGLGEGAGLIGAVAAPEVLGKLGDVAKAAPDAIKSATGYADIPDTVNADLQGSIKDVAGSVASDAGIDASAPSIRTQFAKLADGVETNSKGLYQQIDDATDGEFTNIQNKIKNVDFKLKEIAGTDDAAEERLFNQKVALGTKMDEAIEAAKAKGVDADVADQARQSWKQSSALRDVDSQVKASTFGNNIHAPEVVDPTKLATRLQKLADSGRLQEALGPEQADALLKASYDGAKSAQDVATHTASQAGKRGLTKTLAVKVGLPTVGFGTYEGLKAAGILGGKHK